MMNCISKELLEKIKKDGQLRLSVLSTYRDVINFVTADQRIISILYEKNLSPMSIRIGSRREYEEIKKHAQHTLDFTSESAVDLRRGIEVSDLYLYSHPRNRDKILFAQAVLMEFLQVNAPADSFYPVICQLFTGEAGACKSAWDYQAREYILAKLHLYLQALAQRGNLDAKVNILGFGRGLTPSSDDFIAGLSAVFQYAGDERITAIKRHGEAYLGTTTQISAQMLKNAWNGYYPAQLHSLFQAMAEDALSGQVLRDTIAYGHTSGSDTLCGIVIGLELLKQNVAIFSRF